MQLRFKLSALHSERARGKVNESLDCGGPVSDSAPKSRRNRVGQESKRAVLNISYCYTLVEYNYPTILILTSCSLLSCLNLKKLDLLTNLSMISQYLHYLQETWSIPATLTRRRQVTKMMGRGSPVTVSAPRPPSSIRPIKLAIMPGRLQRLNPHKTAVSTLFGSTLFGSTLFWTCCRMSPLSFMIHQRMLIYTNEGTVLLSCALPYS